jgi:hypothetical protein
MNGHREIGKITDGYQNVEICYRTLPMSMVGQQVFAETPRLKHMTEEAKEREKCFSRKT